MTAAVPTEAVLAGCALAIVGALAGIALLGDLFAAAPAFLVLFVLASLAYALAAVWVVQRPAVSRRGLVGIFVAATLFRLVLLPTTPTLSTDVYRYLWDGRLTVAGVSPYRYAADAPELAAFRDTVVYPRLSHLDWRTIYPPGAQLLFAGVAWVAPGSAGAFKLVVVLFDLLALGLLAAWLRALGRPPAWALLYGWHPLVVVELAGSGHLDALAIAATVAALWAAARGREGLAGALLAGGALVKLYPLLLLPAIWQRRPGRALAAAAGVLAAGYAPYAAAGDPVLGSLVRYLTTEQFNPGLRRALEWALAGLGPAGLLAARLLPLAALGVLALAVGLRGRQVPAWQRAAWLVGAYLVTTPSLFPWYALWMVPLLAVAPAWPWLYLTCAVGLTYVVFAQPVWAMPGWVTAAQWLPFALGLGLAGWPRPTLRVSA